MSNSSQANHQEWKDKEAAKISASKYSGWSEEKLRRKIEQEAEMASLALQDGDPSDAERHFKLERDYITELRSR